MLISFGPDSNVIFDSNDNQVRLSDQELDELAQTLRDVEPLTEGARVVDNEGDMWQRVSGGWVLHKNNPQPWQWIDLVDTYGPLARL